MNSGFFFKMAADNIRRNARLYVPRVLAEAGLLGCFYILFTLALDKRLAQALGGSYLPAFMAFGAVVIGLLSLVLILYINSFLMKRRRSEYGLYNVLGMEKRHIVRVLLCESLIASLLSSALGLLFGALFYKLSSLLICRLLRAGIVAGFYYLSAPTLLYSAAIFLGLDFLAFLAGSVSIRRLQPVELLAGRHTGEREPRVKWALLTLGVLTLGAGYGIALSVLNPLEALLWFFAAVLLVIIGTYCLFVTGTTFVLKALKRSKRYYYDRRHMPAVSGLLFRMKQNAVGLASIAILSTGVLVMISTTVSLYSGVEDSVAANYPQHLYLSAYAKDGEQTVHLPFEALESVARQAAADSGLKIAQIGNEKSLTVSYLMRGGRLLTRDEAVNGWSVEELTSAVFITQQTYARLRGEGGALDLRENEIAFARVATPIHGIGKTPRALTIGGREYAVKQELTYFPVQGSAQALVNVIGVVVADDAVLDDICRAQKAAYGDFASEYASRVSVTFADEEAAAAANRALTEEIARRTAALLPAGSRFVTLDTKWDSLRNLLEMYGTFLFLGILLGFVCLFSTILIIYYKQISEGYEDRPRFQIMQKLGMEARAVKRAVGSQLILQFFLPLATAGVHTAVAFPILLTLLRVLMLSNTRLFALCALITFAVFALVYAAVYALTAKTYYKIVH